MHKAILVALLFAQVVVINIHRRSTASGGACTGLTACDAGSTMQASGHTCTIANVTLATGDSIVIAGATYSLGGTLTATWNGSSATELGGGQTNGDGEGHAFSLDNVTGATGSVVVTKTSAGDDSAVFDCIAVRVTGLTTHALDQSTSTSNSASTTYTTGATGTTTAASEVIVAVLEPGGALDSVTFGAWSNSFTSLANVGNATGSCCTVAYGKFVASSTGTFTGTTTGNTSKASAGFIFTFK